MSVESAKAFVDRMKQNDEFSGKIKECKDPQERSRLVKEAGFAFTADEITAVSRELSDMELELVWGGFDCDADGWLVCTSFVEGLSLDTPSPTRGNSHEN